MESVSPSEKQQPSSSSVENSGESSDSEKRSVLQFVLQICRKHGLVKDRVTLLSPSDFLQILQLCQAQVQKKMGKDFSPENSRIFNLARTVLTQKQSRSMAEVSIFLPETSPTDDSSTTKAASSPQETPDKTPHKSLSVSHTNCSTSSDNRKLTSTPQDMPHVTPCKFKSPAHMMSHTDSARTPRTPRNIPGPTPSKCGQRKKEEADRREFDSLVTLVMEEYDRFLVNSNHVDAVDVLQMFLLELLKPDCDFGDDLPPLEISDCPQDPLQALAMQLLVNRRSSVQEGDKKGSPLSQNRAAADTKAVTLTAADLWPEREAHDMEDSEFKSGSQGSQSDVSEELVGELFHCYLQLLVNSRSELALTHVFNCPDRGLSHHAFTHLKHLAQGKNMSLYQTALSVITKIRLGGKGYAPDPNNKLLQYVKGLSDLSDLMDKLQEILEDLQCIRSSVFRVVGVVRKSLIGCKSQRYTREVVERAGKRIQKDLEGMMEQLQGDNLLVSPDKPACQGGSLTSRRPRRVLLHYLDQRAVSLWGTPGAFQHTWLRDIPFGPHTPSRFPCVLSQFRSPAAGSESPSVHGKQQKEETAQRKRKMVVSTNLLPEESDQPLLQRCVKRMCDTVIVLPSKTIVQPAESRASIFNQGEDPSDKENLQSSNIQPRKKPRKATGSNRSSNTSSNRSSSNNSSPSTSSAIPMTLAAKEGSGQKNKQKQSSGVSSGKQAPKAGKKCRRRLLSPVKGQRSITSFFRV